MSHNLRAGEFFGRVPHKMGTPLCVMTEVVHQTRTSVPRHSHELGHFQLLVRGSYIETFDGSTIASSPMTISWHRPGLTHKDEIGNNGGTFFMIEMRPEAITRFENFAALPDDFSIKSNFLVSLASRLYGEFKNWDLGSELIAEGVTLEMLAHLARTTNIHERRPPTWLKQTLEKINAEFLEELRTVELAASAGVHPVHLAAVFRQFHHETVGEYIQRLRVSHASELLADKKMTLSEVAYASGFADQSHFTRVFKRHTGVTPGKFREILD
jgi:AraC family transcriptional regulator